MTINLRIPRADDEAAFEAARVASPADNSTFLFEYQEGMSFSDFLNVLEDHRIGKNLPPGMVPSTFLFAFNQAVIVGRASLRHCLTQELEQAIGHIGYFVLPEFRRCGYATQILAATMRFAQTELGMQRVLVTCDDDNAASIRVIEKNGGVFENTYHDDRLRRPKLRYWIQL